MPKVSTAGFVTVVLTAAAVSAGLVLGSGSAAVTSVCTPAGWPQPRQSSCATGSVSDRGLSSANVSRLRLAWTANLGDAHGGVAIGQPVAAAGRVYVVSNWARPRLFAIDLTTGRIRWSASAGMSIGQPEFLTPIVDGAVLLRLSSSNTLGRFDEATGRIVWHSLAIGPQGSPGEQVAADGRWYWSSGEELQALSEKRGNTVWRLDNFNCFHCGVAAANGRLYAAGSTDLLDDPTGKLYAFDGRTGKMVWASVGTGKFAFASSPMLAGDTILVVTTDSPAFFLEAFRASDGQALWHTQICTARGAWFQAAADDSNVVVYPCTDGVLYVLDVHTGALRWKRPLATPDEFNSPALANGIVWDVDGNRLIALSAADGHLLWRSRLLDIGGSSPIVADGTVLVGTGDGYLRAYRVK